jgi:hypothetical protein
VKIAYLLLSHNKISCNFNKNKLCISGVLELNTVFQRNDYGIIFSIETNKLFWKFSWTSHLTVLQVSLRLLPLGGDTGSAIAQADSRQPPTTAARVQSHISSCGICGGQSGTEVRFLWVLQFPLPILIPPIAPYSLTTYHHHLTVLILTVLLYN